MTRVRASSTSSAVPVPPEVAAPPVPAAAAEPLVPSLWQVRARHVEAADVVTLVLETPVAVEAARPGQFHMLTAFGVGEIPVSVSGTGDDGRVVRYTVRDVGAVSHALAETPEGAVVGVRGPFGTDWGTDDASGDVVVVAGGVGLVRLRWAITSLCGRAGEDLRVFVAIGAGDPEQVLFASDLRAWQAAGATVAVTVDAAGPGWDGPVGPVTKLLPGLGFEPAATSALVCGPEPTMEVVAGDLVDRGVAASRIRLSMERNMQCGIGRCGHCQLGPLLLCRDGPVVPYDRVARLLGETPR